MPMRFVPSLQPERAFDFDTTADSGAHVSLIAANLVKRFGLKVDATKRIRISAANATQMHCSGAVDAQGRHKVTQIAIRTELKVSESLKDEIIMCYKDLKKLKVIHQNFPLSECTDECRAKVKSVVLEVVPEEKGNIIERLCREFKDTVSNDLPRTPIKAPPVHIKLKEGPVRPIQVTRARPVELHFQGKAYELIKKLTEAGILSEVDYPTKWVSPAKFVPKPNGIDIRLTTNFQQLNKFIERPIHPFLSAYDTIRQISPKAKVFGTLDAVMGYFQLELDEESSELTTFLTPYGKYKYNRSPMGCNASQDWWNKISDQVVIDHQEFSAKIVDDILVWAENFEQLYERMRKILLKCQQLGITISEKKMQVGKEVKFAGFLVTSEGIKPDPEKTRCLKEFPTPTDVTSLRSYIGLANQLGSFIPDLSQAMVKMRSLLKKDTAFVWTPEVNAEFERSKEILTSDMLVKPFDPALKTGLLTDASRLHGLGYILLQWGAANETRIVQCGSFALTPAQKNYSTIELEFLAIVRAMEKCKFYLHGMETFKVITDHKPLLGVMNKEAGDLNSNRLARLREKVSQFTFDIEWTAGKYHFAADALSRFPIFDAYEDEFEAVVKSVAEDPRLVALAKEAARDDRYQEVVAAFKGDNRPDKLPFGHAAKELQSVWDEVSIIQTSAGDLLAVGERVFVPRSQRAQILAQLHSTHQGIVKTRLAAQRSYFWPGISNEIKNLVENCDACQKLLPSQSAEPEKPVVAAISRPLELVSADIYELGGKSYLAMVDAYSGFVEVEYLARITSESVIKAIEKFFQLTGYPERLRSDNGRQFVSEEIRRFYESRGIRHETSSPEFPSSNGHAENAVKMAKRLQKKCLEKREDFKAALAEMRRQPRQDGQVPSDLLWRRRVRGDAVNIAENPGEIVQKSVREKNPENPENPAKKELRQLETGEIVRVQNPKTKEWAIKAKVIGQCQHDRSYLLERCDDRSAFRRNRIYLRPVRGAADSAGADAAAEAQKVRPENAAQTGDGVTKNAQVSTGNAAVRRSARLMSKQETRA